MAKRDRRIDKISDAGLERVRRVMLAGYRQPLPGVGTVGIPDPHDERHHGGRPGPLSGHGWNLNWRITRCLLCLVAEIKAARKVRAARAEAGSVLAALLATATTDAARSEAHAYVKKVYQIPDARKLAGASLRKWGLLDSDVDSDFPGPSRVSVYRWSKDYKGEHVSRRELEAEIIRIHDGIVTRPKSRA